MAGKEKLHAASIAKKDEFYTQFDDISNELRHYKDHFRDKIVLCNCDDPYESNFFKYFALNFNYLGLKKLICTCWYKSPIVQTELFVQDDEYEDNIRIAAEPSIYKRGAYKIVLREIKDFNQDGSADLEDVKLFLETHKPDNLKGTGDFRSEECKELLDEADIVVTNPPFSLFREYILQLFDYKKKFLIIGHQNAITYKEIFPHIMNNEIWLGFGFKGGAAHFISHYKDIATASNHKPGMIRVSGVVWFTNLDIDKRHYPIDLYKEYTPEEYPKYDNYDAIEVSKTADIPMDYDGVMGVPITFLDKYCPEQFEIVKFRKGNDDKDLVYTNSSGKKISPYFRILIRKKQ